MASINKLSIRGIRSFSHEREQVIEFYTPLTMIVGANGCGKTTVIECLKYACTGALPPGARNGQSFVHDPKVSGTNEVKANIKLRFAGRDGRASVVVRSFQLTQKKVNLQFKALDGVIRTKDEDGAPVSITHKCTELDKHIPLRLGVSKAILENVVFCHQEDSSWPLQEGAVVKKKFDDIFESARYTKALDTIKKTKQEYAATVKDLKVDLAGLQERLRAAEVLRGELEENQEGYDKIRVEIDAIDARKSKLLETLDKLQAVAEEVDTLEAQRQSLQLSCRDLDVRMVEKRGTIGDDLSSESDEVLKRSLEEFDKKLDAIADEIRFYSDEADRCDLRAQAAKKKKDKLQGEQGSLEAQLSHQGRVEMERDRLMERLSQRYGIPVPTPSSVASGSRDRSAASTGRHEMGDLSVFEGRLQEALHKANADLQEARTEAREEEDRMNTEINALKLEQRRSADAVHAKESELKKVQNEVSSLSQAGALGGAGSQSQRVAVTVSKLERELQDAVRAKEKADKEFEEFRVADKRPQVAREVKTLETRMTETRDSIAEVETVVRDLSEHQEEQSRISVKTAQIRDDTETLEMTVKESTILPEVLGYDLPDCTQETLGQALTHLKQKKADLDETFAESARLVVDLGREVAAEEANLRTKAAELSDVKQQIEDASGVLDVVREEIPGVQDSAAPPLSAERDFDKIVNLWREQEMKQKKKSALHTGVKRVYRAMLERGQQEHRCPACCRDMDNEVMKVFIDTQMSEIDDEGLGTRHAEAKTKQEEAQASIARLQANAQRWRDWRRLSPRAEGLEDIVQDHEKAAASKNEELDKARGEQEEVRRSRDRHHEAVAEAARFVDESNRIKQLEQDVKMLKDRQSRLGTSGNLSEAQEKLRKLNANRDQITGEMEEKRKEQQDLSNRHWQLTSNASILESDLTKARMALDARKEFERKRTALKERGKVLEADLKELKAKEQPLRQQLQEESSKQTRSKDQLRASLDRSHGAHQECQADVKAFARSQAEVAAGVAKKLPETLASIRARLQEATTTVEENEESARENERIMNGKVLQSDKQDQQKKALSDNIEYRALQRELEEKERQVADVNRKITETDSGDVRQRIEDINRETVRKDQKRAELRGRLSGLKDQIRGVENKLASDTYKVIDDKHRRKMIEHRTTEMAVQDLDKYWTALDKALLRFHTMKIADINKIIRELWAMTYSGEDIDMIEIVSGDDEDGPSKAKRSYNYRVVMRKNDATLDMKGRCSAGQRVLASVVIRLALAETFCVSCGILALDEPTTNLDHYNKVGLAHALAKIIRSRSRQSNFQLITITHDEDFVQTMRTELGTQGGFSMPEYYWRISREEMTRGKFYSRIDRLDWEDM